MAGHVPGWLEHFSYRDLIQFQPACILGAEKLRVFTALISTGIFPIQRYRSTLKASANPVRNPQPDRISPSHDGCPRGRTDCAGGITVAKPHPLPGQSIDILSFIVLAAIAGNIRPSHIIHKN